jgi:hypothetical protein
MAEFGAGSAFTRQGAECEQLGPIGPRLLGRLGCDSVMQKVLFSTSGAVLNLGRDTRTVSRAQRRALNARDRGCVVPGCSAPPQWCEAHHVVWWRRGGRTDIDGLALVCGRDHTLIHLGVWDLAMVNGVAWARPPSWIDPLRRWIRNSLHQGADQARALGVQLRLAMPVDDDQALPDWACSDPGPDASRTVNPADRASGPANAAGADSTRPQRPPPPDATG